MRTYSLLATGLIVATAAFAPLQTAEARDRHHDSRHHHRNHHHRPHYYHRPSNGFLFSFNVNPAPRYVVPVRPVYSPHRALVADVQAALVRRGYNIGPIDGIAGSRTRSALADFQHAKGLRSTGEINDPTLRALGVL